MDLDVFTQRVDEVVNREVPEALLRELNLGIHVLPNVQRDGHRYVLGHYSINRLGRHIALFHGSFAAVFGGRSERVWEREISRTVRHEIRHHLESLGGSDELAREERQQKAREQWESFSRKRQPSALDRFLQAFRDRFRSGPPSNH